MNSLNWLPPEILPDSFKDTLAFIHAVECAYKEDFCRTSFQFNGLDVKKKKYPIEINGEDQTFWHITSSGTPRKRSISRCKRIKWTKAIILNSTDPLVNVWEEKDSVIFHLRYSEYNPKENDHIVVLGKRNTYYVISTSYPIEYDHTRRKFLKRFAACCNK